MIDRYSGKDMRAVWTSEAKFAAWLEVEIAVLKAREKLGQIPQGTAEWVQSRTWMDGDVAIAIEQREEATKHDLNAFLDIMRAQMILGPDPEGSQNLRGFTSGVGSRVIDDILAEPGDIRMAHFHDGMTSYDTEEPAMALLFRRATDLVFAKLEVLQEVLRKRAKQHRGQIMMGRTHGQHAQPITFGVKILNWLEMVNRAHENLAFSRKEVEVMKLSGAVGMYGTLGPEVEEETSKILFLNVVPCATQIIALDRRARHLNALAELATVVEKIAHDLWLLAQTEIGEIREPFGKKQKGSSAMPHKKNPITLEKLKGLPKLCRGYARDLLDCVPTAHERDISHSSVERVVVPDAFAVTDHLLHGLAGIIEGMDVFPERMEENLGRSCGTFASQRVETYLKQRGYAPETAYRAVQSAAFEALDRRVDMATVLIQNALFTSFALANDSDFHACFDPRSWIKAEDTIYARMQL